LQSLSMPSQVSADGHRVGSVSQLGALHTSERPSAAHWNEPLAKQWVPARAPLSQLLALCLLLQLAPVTATSGNGSSPTPLQSSSALLHFSVLTVEATISANAASMSTSFEAKRALPVLPAAAIALSESRPAL